LNLIFSVDGFGLSEVKLIFWAQPQPVMATLHFEKLKFFDLKSAS
jgi:hypothetical protein